MRSMATSRGASATPPSPPSSASRPRPRRFFSTCGFLRDGDRDSVRAGFYHARHGPNKSGDRPPRSARNDPHDRSARNGERPASAGWSGTQQAKRYRSATASGRRKPAEESESSAGSRRPLALFHATDDWLL